MPPIKLWNLVISGEDNLFNWFSVYWQEEGFINSLITLLIDYVLVSVAECSGLALKNYRL